MTAASRVVDVVAAFVAVARASRDARARAMARAMGGLGPTFVKFGQALASRADVVGAEASRELSTLCDGMDFFDDAIAVRVIEEELGVGSPVARAARDAGGAAAAASLAQVYRATLDGETVAIKVRRPGIEDVVDADYALLRLGAWLVERVGGVRARARGWMTTTRAVRDARAADADAEEKTAVKLLTSDESENLLKIRHTVRVCRSFRVVG